MANPYYTKPRVSFSNYARSSPNWAGTPQQQPKVLLPGGGHLDANAFVASSDAKQIIVAAPGAATGATNIPVEPLPIAIPVGTILKFGVGRFTLTTRVADAEAIALTVETLSTAVATGDMAYYSNSDRKHIQSGTLVGRTWAERDANMGYGPADVATDEEMFLVYFDVDNALVDNEVELYMSGAGNVVYENFLPGWDTMPPEQKAWIRTNYTCITALP